MSEKIFTPIPHSSKIMEVRALMEDVEKQYITAGETLQNLVIKKYKDEGKELSLKPYMRVQRGFTWGKDIQSNFIVSVMFQDDIPAIRIYGEKTKNTYNKTMDGQQRLTTLWKFINGKLKLDMSHADFNKFPIGDQEYSIDDLHNKTFSELPQEWQDSIMSCPINVIIYTNCTDSDAAKMYRRMARGFKPLKAIEIRKADMDDKMLDFLYDGFLNKSWAIHAMTVNSAINNLGLDISSQFIALLYNNKPIELSKENIDKVIYNLRDFGIPDDLKNKVSTTGDYLSNVTDLWVENKKEVSKTQIKGRKIKNYSGYRFQEQFKNKTFILMFVWAGFKASENGIDINKFADWSFKFFQEPSDMFKQGLADGRNKSNDLKNVELRIQAIEEALTELKGELLINTNSKIQDSIDDSKSNVDDIEQNVSEQITF